MNLLSLHVRALKKETKPPCGAHEYRDRARNAMPNHVPSSRPRFSFTICKLVYYQPGESIHRRFTHTRVINDRRDSGKCNLRGIRSIGRSSIIRADHESTRETRGTPRCADSQIKINSDVAW